MKEVLAWYKYPEPKGTYYFEEELKHPDKVTEIFDYCQILLAHISKAGWDFLTDYYGYEKLFLLNKKSGWFDCSAINEFIECVQLEYESSNGKELDMKKYIDYNGFKYEYLGNGCKATGTNGESWQMSGDIYFRCIDCGYMMNGDPRESDNCPCGSLYKDADYGRLGSKHGDDAIEVYVKSEG
ncbi:MAG: hypothetical protein FWG34_00245 [Oscillospiraceae bacterium]|nr:hypothetical protein [Oscillospiraceae bacterium]